MAKKRTDPEQDRILRADSPLIHVGVTGHRFLQDTDRLIQAIDGVLDQIEAILPDRSMAVISALAEGSDRLVAQRVLRRPGATLIVPLPLPEDEYLEDFRSPASSQAFLDLLALADRVIRFPHAPARPMAYDVAGRYLLDHSDLLIALWDGEPPRGEGGTGSVVSEARGRNLPIFWIYSHHPNPDGSSLRQMTPQGGVTAENFQRLLWPKEK